VLLYLHSQRLPNFLTVHCVGRSEVGVYVAVYQVRVQHNVLEDTVPVRCVRVSVVSSRHHENCRRWRVLLVGVWSLKGSLGEGIRSGEDAVESKKRIIYLTKSTIDQGGLIFNGSNLFHRSRSSHFLPKHVMVLAETIYFLVEPISYDDLDQIGPVVKRSMSQITCFVTVVS
jgi:hypothetical protein